MLVALNVLPARDMATGPGVFGPRTEMALKRFQEAHGIESTGVVNEGTRKQIHASYSQRRKMKAERSRTAPVDRPEGRHASPSETLTDEQTDPMARMVMVE